MGKELGPRDMALLSETAKGKSPQEVGDYLGLPAAQVVLRVKQLLQDRDVYTEIEQRQLFLMDLMDLKNKLMGQMKSYADKDNATTALKTIKLMDEILDKQGKISDDQLMKVTSAQAGAMVRFITGAFQYARAVIAEQYPDADLKQIEAAFNEGLKKEAEKHDG
jgi:hypothetical protein